MIFKEKKSLLSIVVSTALLTFGAFFSFFLYKNKIKGKEEIQEALINLNKANENNKEEIEKEEFEILRASETYIKYNIISSRSAIISSPPLSSGQELDQIFTKYSHKYGVEEDVLKKIAYCESKYNPQAVNGPYGGLYQFTTTSWNSSRREMGLDPNSDLRFNAKEAIKTAAYRISKYGTSSWPACKKLLF